MARAFVTGGSGFIGRRLIHRLVSEGHEVRALVRSERAASVVEQLGAVAVHGELTDATSWQDAVVGSDVLFHLAAETDIDADLERQVHVTVGGTRAAIAAARHASVPRFVHCGSEAALLAGAPLVEVDETAPLRPDSAAAYSATKAESEQLVLDANSADLESVSIRPRFVWGPRSSLVEGLAQAAKDGQFAWVEGGRFTTDVTYVDNAVEGLLLGWHRGTPGEAYFVTDQHRVALRDFLEPQFALYGATGPIPEIDARTAAEVIPVPALWFLSQECTLRTDKAVRDLGYAPVVSHDEGLAALRESLVAAG